MQKMKTERIDRGPTKRRLLRAGLELFGRHDFDNVTTRQIAAEAAVNQAAIPYHFGTKEALYHAVARELVNTVREDIDSSLATLDALLGESAPDRNALFTGLERFVRAFGQLLLDERSSDVRAGFVLREQLCPTPAFDILYDGLMHRVHESLTGVLARILDRDPGSPDMILRGHALIGQILGFRMAREVLLRRLDTRTIDADDVMQQLARDITDALRREADARPRSTKTRYDAFP